MGKANCSRINKYINKINLAFEADTSRNGELVHSFLEEERIFGSARVDMAAKRVRDYAIAREFSGWDPRNP